MTFQLEPQSTEYAFTNDLGSPLSMHLRMISVLISRTTILLCIL